MKILLENVSEQRAEWLRLRQTTVGSSEIATIIGLNQFQTPLELWMEKTGRLPPPEENDAMRLGTLMEKFIGEKFARDTGLLVKPANTLLVHPDCESFTASPDFWVTEQKHEHGVFAILECKNVNYRRADEWADGNCPDSAQLQLQWQLEIAGLSGGYVAGLVGAQVRDFHSREFERDKSIGSRLLEKGHEFLQMVISDTPPAATANDIRLLELGLQPSLLTIQLPETSLPLLRNYAELLAERKLLEAQSKEAKEREDGLRAQIEQILIGENAGAGEVGEFRVELVKREKKAYSVNASSYFQFTVKKDGKRL